MTSKLFRLISRRGLFRLQKRYRNAAGIDCVLGISLDGRYQTVARAADVVWLEPINA